MLIVYSQRRNASESQEDVLDDPAFANGTTDIDELLPTSVSYVLYGFLVHI